MVKKKRRNYTKELKEAVVKLITGEGYSFAEKELPDGCIK